MAFWTLRGRMPAWTTYVLAGGALAGAATACLPGPPPLPIIPDAAQVDVTVLDAGVAVDAPADGTLREAQGADAFFVRDVLPSDAISADGRFGDAPPGVAATAERASGR